MPGQKNDYIGEITSSSYLLDKPQFTMLCTHMKTIVGILVKTLPRYKEIVLQGHLGTVLQNPYRDYIHYFVNCGGLYTLYISMFVEC